MEDLTTSPKIEQVRWLVLNLGLSDSVQGVRVYSGLSCHPEAPTLSQSLLQSKSFTRTFKSNLQLRHK